MLTDLEAAAVGEILKHQPCTAHFIRTCFRESLTSHFSNSAGSVYPMMKRLEKRRVLKSVKSKEGRRYVRYYSVTSEGQADLRRWLTTDLGDQELISIDPIRTRLLYLHRLPKSKRVGWINRRKNELKTQIAEIRKQSLRIDSGSRDAIYQELAIENAVVNIQTRLKWLGKVESRLRSEGQL